MQTHAHRLLRQITTGIPTVLISDCAISRKKEVIRRVLAHHIEQTRQAAARARPTPAPGYRPETLDVLFRNGTS